MAVKPIKSETTVSPDRNGHSNGKLVIQESKDFRWSTNAGASPVTAKAEVKKKAKPAR